jgi:imidazolonepropionase-like amidohydrolase
LAGPISDRGKGLKVTTEEEAQQAIDRYAHAGYTQIKIHASNYPPAFVAFIANAAHATGMRISGHVPFGMKAEQFVTAGADEIQHMPFLLENFLPAGVTGDAAAKDGARLDLDSAPVAHFVDLLKQKHVVIDPTMNVFENKYATRDPRYYQAMTTMLKRLYDADVLLVVGTDAPARPGSSLHHEMEIWAGVGIPPSTILQMATIQAAHVMHVDAETGSIRVGKKADLLLVDGDPDAEDLPHPQRPARRQRWGCLRNHAVVGHLSCRHAARATSSRNKT